MKVIDRIKIKLDVGAKAPHRAHPEDAGLDLFNNNVEEATVIKPYDRATFHTGVHAEIPVGYYGKIESKSGLNVNHGIVSCGGVIDSGYDGEILVELYNITAERYHFHRGEKIAQLIIMRCELPEIEVVDEINSGERGNNGFGSSGR